ncbi:ABC transporter ATP-binding protein [Streptococcus mutans]|uniref:ABC transporter ATP-binding protein n=1 Tax=Streptococcus mutans TaxID=1309 RepID=A0AAX1K4Q4_STRMG|nr:ABC transporter ATP-binding protein [Streptococcus mutans]MCB4944068.1 ABC transporter ATP-binding protein [Streptococcus mutans]MCB5018423.1 ABC transporter ATP-binding protein [Streptococcus mutans]MCB5083931.1 ABC transporter ATP-binding protein [Streptococcus mutans]MCB5084782.1 ABC transporter ATP-binding protein [Streptococcus mutans]MCB5132292.1 ABC transporter ATP-binding protein [Streptococcus mutans]
MKRVLEIKHLSKRYGQQLALDNVNLTIQKGEIYGLIGKNGAGKTTLIKVITKLIQPSQGSVSVFGSSTQSEWTHALKRVGSVIETPVALNHLTARQNLHYYCKARHVPNADKVIDESLTLVGLTNTGKKKFRGFSLGMKQRLGIAIALIVKPDFLILDEPINGLDPVAIKEFRHMIKKLNEEHDMTVIISSHILSELYQVATKFGIIENGRIIKEISKADFDTQSEDYIVLKTSHINEASQILQDQMNYRIKVTNADNEIHVFGQSHSIKGIVKELVANAVDIDEIYYKRQDLEDYFTQIVE